MNGLTRQATQISIEAGGTSLVTEDEARRGGASVQARMEVPHVAGVARFQEIADKTERWRVRLPDNPVGPRITADG